MTELCRVADFERILPGEVEVAALAVNRLDRPRASFGGDHRNGLTVIVVDLSEAGFAVFHAERDASRRRVTVGALGQRRPPALFEQVGILAGQLDVLAAVLLRLRNIGAL